MIRLVTERLVLREFSMDDVDGLHALESLPEVVRYQTYPPRSREQAEQVVHEIVKAQAEVPREHVELAVTLEGTLIGRVGAWIKDQKASVWYAFLPSAQGKGFATEATRAFIGRLPVSQVSIECDPRNVASWKLAERLGFTKRSFTERAFEAKGEWVDSLVYVLDRAPG